MEQENGKRNSMTRGRSVGKKSGMTAGGKAAGEKSGNAQKSGKKFGEKKQNAPEAGRKQGMAKQNAQTVGKKEAAVRGDRTDKESLCPVAGKCGGCQWINREYAEQLKAKETRFRRLMEPYCRPEPIVAMEEPTHYRNKVHAVFGEDRRHNVISGIYEAKSHRIVPVDSCLIENRKADEIICSIRGLLPSFKIRPYNEDTGYGLLRHVLIRVGHATGQIMVVLVLASPIMPSKNNFVKALLKLHPEITTIVVNVNERGTSMVLGNKEQVIYGKGYIEDVLCGRSFRISARSFYQVNPVQTEKLYQKAIGYAGLTGSETLVDAYCGTGTIGLIAAKEAGKVIGVELNADAVRDAGNNAKANRVKNIAFYQNDAGKFLLEMAEQRVAVDVVMMDPPRSGSTEEFLDAVGTIAPEKVVYVSCNPETLVRDLKYLTKKGYRAEKCGAVDMFPFTEEIEAVVLLSKGMVNSRGASPVGHRKLFF